MSRAAVAGSVPAIAGFITGFVTLIGAAGTARAQPVTFDYTVYATSGPWSYSPGLVNPSYSYNTQGTSNPVLVSNFLDLTSGNNITITYLSGTDTTNIYGNPVQYVDANGYSPGNGYGYQKNNPGAPGNYIATTAWLQELVGTFTDPTGNIVGLPFVVGDGPTTVTVPVGAQQLLLGINDDGYTDNAGDLEVSVTGIQSSNTVQNGIQDGLEWTVTSQAGQSWNYTYAFTNTTSQEIDHFEVPIWSLNQVSAVIAPPNWFCQASGAFSGGWAYADPGIPAKAIFGDAPDVVDCSASPGDGILPGQTADFAFNADSGPIFGPVGYAYENFNEVSYIDPGVPSPVPEPTTLGLLATGLAAIGVARRRCRTPPRSAPTLGHSFYEVAPEGTDLPLSCAGVEPGHRLSGWWDARGGRATI